MILAAAAAVSVPTAVATGQPAPGDHVAVAAKDHGDHKDDGNTDKGNRKTPVATPTPTPPATPKPSAKPKPKPKPKPKHKDKRQTSDDPVTPGTDDTAQTPSATPAPAKPVKGEWAVGHRTSGTVTVTLPGATEATPVETTSLALGSTVDATHGTVQVSTALPGGETQQATFWGGRFRLTQGAKTGRVAIHMPKVSIAKRCDHPAATASASSVIATTSAKKKKHSKRLKSLWVRDDHGAFTTHGRNSVATVRGTEWVTRERCDGTFTYVRKGRVDVRDRRTGRVVKLRARHAFLARN